ncbi:PREDICTED: zinc finger protein with KRAB and SCAN domains 1-like isoform X1 [Branchiostoma belcheri]|uniref:Zinc finger protein with KRAB and SCAN domains 1-like isoform X1 n=2 Tax=Branchiostoma belcheri TaxID=7741 RepID=A0A6P4YA27_BRABE|nr:PREDICTED: zinc finger protein with KRAB and SCAN domains 1-like isoform X1 [Branchiostoma belcheri]
MFSHKRDQSVTRKTASKADYNVVKEQAGSSPAAPMIPGKSGHQEPAKGKTHEREAKTKASIKEAAARKRQSKSEAEGVTLDQLRKMSEFSLVKRFAQFAQEVSCRTNTVRHIYSCQLIPSRCQAAFEDDGSNDGRGQIKRHLLSHVGELLQECANEPEKVKKMTFHPVGSSIYRKKKAEEADESYVPTAKRTRSGTALARQQSADMKPEATPADGTVEIEHSTCMVPVPTVVDNLTLPDPQLLNHSSFTMIKTTQDSEEILLVPKGQLIPLSPLIKQEDPTISAGMAEGKSPQKHVPNILRRNRKQTFNNILTDGEIPTSNIIEQGSSLPQTPLHAQERSAKRSPVKSPSKRAAKILESMANRGSMTTRSSKLQPHHDHNYTSPSGATSNQTTTTTTTTAGGTPTTLDGNANLKLLSQLAVQQSAEVNGEGEEEGSDTEEEAEVDMKPNPYVYGVILEGDALVGKQPSPRKPGARGQLKKGVKKAAVSKAKLPNNQEAGEDPEQKKTRQKALDLLNQLKRKKLPRPEDVFVPFLCDICGKHYTASATLISHLRSHAGIKPYSCKLCKATFTRLHSLNYHMMMHNNQSRFTCEHCGRKFRHPSHFKEHLRRHTGESPFACCDCPRRFKTRNTYKRHLRSKHGKILTVSGIIPMRVDVA